MAVDREVTRQDGESTEKSPRHLQRRASARAVALRVLTDMREGRKTAQSTIETLVERYRQDRRERALTTELAMGVIRHRLSLARILGQITVNGWKRVNRRLQNVLSLAAYQIIWLDQVPSFAAVNEAVEQAKTEGGVRAGRFVNGVLRELLRRIDRPRVPLDQADPNRSIQVDRGMACQFQQPILPDPAADPIEHLALATSHPTWLVSRWVDQFGFEKARRACLAGALRPVLFVRPNALRCDAASLVERLRDEGFEAEVAEDVEVVAILRGQGLMESATFAQGWFQPQDPTAMAVVRSMKVKPGQYVLDLCAGLGTKSTQLAEMMADKGTVIATDLDEGKLASLQENATRLGTASVQAVAFSRLEEAVRGLPRLDWILIDAPCSNTGVFVRRPEARYRLNTRNIEKLRRVQLELMEQAARLARPTTRLCYSTCSIDEAENGEVTRLFAHRHPDWQCERMHLTLPDPGQTALDSRDGGCYAIWKPVAGSHSA